jgi:hypothetical protein
MEWQEVGGRMWKSLRLRTKIEAIVAIFFIVLLVTASVASVSRTITDSSDSVETYIRNSNGKYWPPTGANLQIAVDDLTSGGTVYVPARTIDLSSDLTINNNVWLKGSGIGNTVLRQADGTTFFSGVIDANTKNNFTISDLTVDGNIAGVIVGYNCITIRTCTDFIVRDVSVINPEHNGIRISAGCSRGIISNIIGEYIQPSTAGDQVINVVDSRQLAIDNVVVKNWDGLSQALDFSGTKESTVSNINVNNVLLGMKLTGSASSMTENCTFTNLIFTNITGNGAAAGISIGYAKHCSFNNIQLYMKVTAGPDGGMGIDSTSSFINLNNILVYRSDGVGLTIAANNVSASNIFIRDTTRYTGVYITGKDITISNINIQNSYASGIKMASTLRVTIIGGIIENSGVGTSEYGIEILGTKYTVLNSLIIVNNKGDGLDATQDTNSNYTITNCYFYGNAKAIDTGATDNYYVIIGNTCYEDAIDDNNAGATKVIANNIATIT